MAAIEIASKVNEIGFAEFTSKLVKDTFETLVTSQIDQIEAYTELVQETAKTLNTYINDTKDSIGGPEIFSFIQNILPDLTSDSIQADNDTDEPLNTGNPAEDAQRATALDNAVTVTEDDGSGSEIQPSSTITTTSSSSAILDAVATRIAANKYNLLTEIVQTGLIRLVVTDGVIESKLNFTTSEFKEAKTEAESYNRFSYGRGRSFSFTRKVFSLRSSSRFNYLRVSTRSSTTSSSSETSINIQGLVRINFKSDYQPLNAPVST